MLITAFQVLILHLKLGEKDVDLEGKGYGSGVESLLSSRPSTTKKEEKEEKERKKMKIYNTQLLQVQIGNSK